MANEVRGETLRLEEDRSGPLEGTRREVLKTALVALGANVLATEASAATLQPVAPGSSPSSARSPATNAVPSAASGPVKELYSMETVRMVASVSDTFYPPNSIQDARGQTRILRASDARPERYLQHRAAWEPAFGEAVLGALRNLSELSERHHGQGFELLSPEEKTALLERFQEEARPSFEVLHTALSAGLFADPEYGGNSERVGWYYSRYLEVG